jgi:hypothetical protein
MAETPVQPHQHNLADPGQAKIKGQQRQEIPELPIRMRKAVGTGLGTAKLARPIDDILDAKKEQQRRCLGQDHPYVRQAGKREDPHLR